MVVFYLPDCDLHPRRWANDCESLLKLHRKQCTDIIPKFGPIIVEDFGFDAAETVLMLMPTYTVVLFGIIFVGLVVPRIKNSRLITMAALDLVAMTGVFMVMLIPRQTKWGRLCGVWLIAFVAPSWPLMLSIFASNTAGFTKKSTTSVFIFVAYCVGNIIGPQFFLAKEAPRYEVSSHHLRASAKLTLEPDGI